MSAANGHNDPSTTAKAASIGSKPQHSSSVQDRFTAELTRVKDSDGFVGTVAYVGPVASSKDASRIYVGVRWDDVRRGKHDGSVVCRKTKRFVRHFHCDKATQGSFMKPELLDTGLNLTPDLLRQRYVERNAPLIAGEDGVLPHKACTASGRDDKPIEFLGELQIRERQQLNEINTVAMRCEGLSGMDTDAKWDEFDHLTDMDLAGNLFCTWQALYDVLRRFSRLERLSMASNRIRDVVSAEVPADAGVLFQNLRVLNLNRCGIASCQTVRWIGEQMPLLEELCVAYSDLADLRGDQDGNSDWSMRGFAHLKLLDCSSCNITSWSEQVERLSKLPRLQQLSLDDNDISMGEKMGAKDEATFSPYFDSLQSLQLAGTQLSTWSELQTIQSVMPRLISLRLQHTPLTSSLGQGEVRAQVVARYPSLSLFNGSLVSASERTEAERRYVILVTRLLERVEGDEQTEEIRRQHPMYEQLCETHRDVVAATSSRAADQNGTGSGMTVYNVTITSQAADSCHMAPLVRRLPGSLPVGRLKALCSRAFGGGTLVDCMTLHFRTEANTFPIELDDNDHTLDYFGVCDGAKILMNEIDMEAKQREAEHEAAVLEARMEAQEEEMRALRELSQQQRGGSAAAFR